MREQSCVRRGKLRDGFFRRQAFHFPLAATKLSVQSYKRRLLKGCRAIFNFSNSFLLLNLNRGNLLWLLSLLLFGNDLLLGWLLLLLLDLCVGANLACCAALCTAAANAVCALRRFAADDASSAFNIFTDALFWARLRRHRALRPLVCYLARGAPV